MPRLHRPYPLPLDPPQGGEGAWSSNRRDTILSSRPVHHRFSARARGTMSRSPPAVAACIRRMAVVLMPSPA